MLNINKTKEKTMDICLECGEDLKLDSNDFLICNDNDCKESKSSTFDKISHIEQQNLINQIIDNT